MLVPVAQASIPHSICANSQLFTEKIRRERTYRRQNKSNGFYRERIKHICIYNTLVARIVEPTPIDYLLYDRVLVEAMFCLKILQIKMLESRSCLVQRSHSIPCIDSPNYYS